MAEHSLAGARQFEEMCRRSPSGVIIQIDSTFRELEVSIHESPPLLEVANATRPLSRSSIGERLPSLEDFGQAVVTFLDASPASITPDSPTLIPKSATTSVISEPHYPSHSDDDILALNSFSFFSLVGDSTSVDDSEFNVSARSMDTSPPPFSVTLPQPSSSSSSSSSSKLLTGVSGLGISGLTRKDGSGPFDGLGIVSIESENPSWRHLERAGSIEVSDSIQGFNRPHPSSSSAYHGSEDCDQPAFKVVGGDNISDIFLQETFLTFTDDPFHALCHSSTSSSSIPDCGNSWSELSLEDESTSASTSDSLPVVVGTTKSPTPSTHEKSPPPPMVLNHRLGRTPNLNTNFSSPTISSELKRSSTPKIITLRNRSSSWPSSSGSTEATTSAIPTTLPRRKWRL